MRFWIPFLLSFCISFQALGIKDEKKEKLESAVVVHEGSTALTVQQQQATAALTKFTSDVTTVMNLLGSLAGDRQSKLITPVTSESRSESGKSNSHSSSSKGFLGIFGGGSETTSSTYRADTTVSYGDVVREELIYVIPVVHYSALTKFVEHYNSLKASVTENADLSGSFIEMIEVLRRYSDPNSDDRRFLDFETYQRLMKEGIPQLKALALQILTQEAAHLNETQARFLALTLDRLNSITLKFVLIELDPSVVPRVITTEIVRKVHGTNDVPRLYGTFIANHLYKEAFVKFPTADQIPRESQGQWLGLNPWIKNGENFESECFGCYLIRGKTILGIEVIDVLTKRPYIWGLPDDKVRVASALGLKAFDFGEGDSKDRRRWDFSKYEAFWQYFRDGHEQVGRLPPPLESTGHTHQEVTAGLGSCGQLLAALKIGWLQPIFMKRDLGSLSLAPFGF